MQNQDLRKINVNQFSIFLIIDKPFIQIQPTPKSKQTKNKQASQSFEQINKEAIINQIKNKLYLASQQLINIHFYKTSNKPYKIIQKERFFVILYVTIVFDLKKI
ncbi:hypothetical protein TTHERM_01132930 (macronuclear) [Tetrahymena thermophila SB210]|uniref:Uncharacterized protein n=1 Tax=Tetrahymena thermophila (strain SB210) TaxID=312017 RepID=Q24HT9_TETTS|nr:hypothetical protein TTHERM_01132930 [Tetrahymena thermophila SB210]EAS07348.1 hypothetical protein TTHERM_01132930 [Tetrahymena thermophila SB210]|eukprot:XP_001027590.1 hypothetical protein TTHERM_01132930 [Tetrahymena thermophila SB210]